MMRNTAVIMIEYSSDNDGKIWGEAKPKVRSGTGDELKNILILSNCYYLKKNIFKLRNL